VSEKRPGGGGGSGRSWGTLLRRSAATRGLYSRSSRVAHVYIFPPPCPTLWHAYTGLSRAPQPYVGTRRQVWFSCPPPPPPHELWSLCRHWHLPHRVRRKAAVPVWSADDERWQG